MAPANGQFPQPKLDDLFPCVIQRGKDQEVRIAGGDLEEARELWCTQSGIVATPKMLPANEVREFPEPEAGVFQVRVDRHTNVGTYDVQVIGRSGLSGSKRLQVVDQEVIVPPPSLDRMAPTEIRPHTVCLARAQATAEHYYRVSLAGGSSWIVDVDSSQIDSRMEPCVVVFGARGEELQRQRSDRRQRVMVEVPTSADGVYTIGVYDATYRGGNDYPYVLHVRAASDTSASTEPSGTAVPPPASNVVAEGDANDVLPLAPTVSCPSTITGTFFPAKDVDWFTFAAHANDVIELQVTSADLGSSADPVLVVVKLVKNDAGVITPQEVARIDDVEQATRGGWQFGSLHNQSSDPTYRLKCDSDGMYAACVHDAYHSSRGERDFVYRLQIAPAQAQYGVTVLPAALQREKIVDGTGYTVRRGGSLELPVRVHRTEGADAPLRIWLTGLPPGVECPEVIVPPGQKDVRLVLTANATAGAWRGTIQARFAPTTNPGTPLQPNEAGECAESLALGYGTPDLEALAPTVRPIQGVPLLVLADDNIPLAAQTPVTQPTTWTRGTTLEIPVHLVRTGYTGPVEFTVSGLPDKQFQVADNTLTGDQGTLKISLPDPKQPASGWYNLQIQAKLKSPYSRNPQAIRRAELAAQYVSGVLGQKKQALEQVTAAQAEALKARDAAKQAWDTLQAQATALKDKKAASEQAITGTWKAWQEANAVPTPDVNSIKQLASQLQAQATELAQHATAWADLQTGWKPAQDLATQTEAAWQGAEAQRLQLTQAVELATKELELRNKQLEEARKNYAVSEAEFTVRTTTVSVQLRDAPSEAS